MSTLVAMPSKKCTSAVDALRDALVKAEAGEISEVLIIYQSDNGQKAGSLDSDLTIKDSLYLIELFKHWLMSCVLKP